MTEHFVVDPSVLIQAYVSEPLTDHMLALLEQVPEDIELHIPEFCLVECINILWKHVRFQGMPAETAKQAAQDLFELRITVHPAAAYLQTALSLGLEHELAIYDVIYLTLAQRLQLPLITADAKQEQIARKAGISIKPLTDFAPTE